MSEKSKVKVFIANFANDLYIADSLWNHNRNPEISFVDASKEVQERFLYLGSHLLGINEKQLSREDISRLEPVFELLKAKHTQVEIANLMS